MRGVLTALGLAVIVGLVTAAPASAVPLNFGFEDGVDGVGHPLNWNALGNVSVVGADTFNSGSPAFTPAAGSFQLRLSTLGSSTDVGLASTLLGFALDDSVTGVSMVVQQLTADVPTLSFVAEFVTGRARTGPNDLADAAFVAVSGFGGAFGILFDSSDTGDDLIPDDSGVLFRHSGPRLIEIDTFGPGTVTLAYGIFHTSDPSLFGESRLYIDANIAPNAPPAAVPEPATISLIALGLAAMRGVRGRRRA